MGTRELLEFIQQNQNESGLADIEILQRSYSGGNISVDIQPLIADKYVKFVPGTERDYYSLTTTGKQYLADQKSGDERYNVNQTWTVIAAVSGVLALLVGITALLLDLLS